MVLVVALAPVLNRARAISGRPSASTVPARAAGRLRMDAPSDEAESDRAARPWLAFYEPGGPESLPYPDASLDALLRETAAQCPHRVGTRGLREMPELNHWSGRADPPDALPATLTARQRCGRVLTSRDAERTLDVPPK